MRNPHSAAVIDDPADLSLAAASREIEAGRLTPSRLLQAVLDRKARFDGVIYSYLRDDLVGARAQAEAADKRTAAGERLGPLDGIPFGVKDNVYTRTMETTAGSRVPQTHDRSLHANVVTRLESAGAVLIGKLNTWEYGTGNGGVTFDLPVPPARNPWNPAYFTGGSSTGAGASVAAGTATFAIGTDTGGSVRLPAAACGVVGLKPTFGRISRHGMMPNCYSFDTPGPLTITVEDAALVYDVVAGYDPLDPISLDAPVERASDGLRQGVAGLKIAVVRRLSTADKPLEQSIADALEKAAVELRDAGADIFEIELPVAPTEYRKVTGPINLSESFSIHERDFLDHGHLMGPALRDKMETGMYMRAADYIAAQRQRRILVKQTDTLFGRFDAILLPMTCRTAPLISDDAAVKDFTAGSGASPFSLSGHPALALPAGFTEGGLPISVQLAAGYLQEALLLRIAFALEQRLNPKPARALAEKILAHSIQQESPDDAA
jgi:aspartyl-tRNA(Asn)/glutamyl-tRNA(Gln) amidotransferase subunit A